MASNSNSRALVVLLLTSGFLLAGLLFDYMPAIVDDQIKRSVELVSNEQIKSLWSKPPVDVHSYYWLYDVLNGEQFLAGEKVRVRKVGPYHFTSKMEKQIIGYSQNKLRVSYNSSRLMSLDESSPSPLANSRLDEPLVLLNPIYASIMEGTREMLRTGEPSMRSTILASVRGLASRFNETLLRNSTAREALLGRRLVLMEKARKLADTFGMSVQLPDVLPNNVFGYVAIQNNTPSGPFELYTGYQESAGSLGDLISFQGRRRQTEYSGRCNRIQASVGELRPMPIAAGQVLELYQPRMCRIVHLLPTGERKLREGRAISYVISARDFMAADENPDNRCYCLNNTLNDYCSLSGAIELAPCSYYSPVVLTMNHLEPDRRITDTIQDWSPELINSEVELVPASNQSSQLLILARIGVPLQADITIIMYMKVIRDPSFRDAGSLPEVSYVPIVMVREMVTIPAKLAQIVVNLESFLALTYHIKVVMYLSALVLLCWLTSLYYDRGGSSAAARRSTTAPGDSSSAHQEEPGGGAHLASGKLAGAANRHRVAPATSVASDRPESGESSGSAKSGRSRPSRGQPAPASCVVGGATEQREVGASPSSSSQMDPPNRAQARAKTTAPTKRTFSKVDELAEMKSEPQQQKPDESGQPNDLSPAPESRANDSAGDQRPDGAHLRRNWFVKVCSNFVRLLSGLRSSINEASQLDIRESDYQDRQLEMLADKIDNWYTSSHSADASAGPKPPAGEEPRPTPSAPASIERRQSKEMAAASERSQPAERKESPSESDSSETNPRPEVDAGRPLGPEPAPVEAEDKGRAFERLELELALDSSAATSLESIVEAAAGDKLAHLNRSEGRLIDGRRAASPPRQSNEAGRPDSPTGRLLAAAGRPAGQPEGQPDGQAPNAISGRPSLSARQNGAPETPTGPEMSHQIRLTAASDSSPERQPINGQQPKLPPDGIGNNLLRKINAAAPS